MTTPSSTERPVLDIEQVISGPPNAVFQAWLDPEQLKLWFCGSNTTVSRVEIDARVGGAYRIVMPDADRDWIHTGIYQEIDPPRRLSVRGILERDRNRLMLFIGRIGRRARRACGSCIDPRNSEAV